MPEVTEQDGHYNALFPDYEAQEPERRVMARHQCPYWWAGRCTRIPGGEDIAKQNRVIAVLQEIFAHRSWAALESYIEHLAMQQMERKP